MEGQPGRGPLADVLNRGKKSLVLDLKRPEAVEALLTVVEGVDVLVGATDPGSPSGWGSVPTRSGRAIRSSCTAG